MTIPNWLKAALLMVITLAAGVTLGIAVERRHTTTAAVPMMGQRHLVQHLQTGLGLDSAQHREILEILARHQSSVDSTWQVIHPIVRATLDSALREIAGVLRPDQLERYRTMLENRHPGAIR